MTEPVMLVTMTTAHIAELMRYEKAMFGPESWSASAYREELADRTHRHYVTAVDSAGALLGWAGLRVVADVGEILTVGVIPTARRHGIGARLVQELIEEAGRRGAQDLFLDVRFDNEAALRIYTRAGFSTVGRRRGYYDNGRTDSLTMSLKLPVPE